LLPALNRIVDPDYLPYDADILLADGRSSAIVETVVHIDSSRQTHHHGRREWAVLESSKMVASFRQVCDDLLLWCTYGLQPTHRPASILRA
ncbi:unnamed protein product, partial [Mycena citricolor]